MKIGIVSDSHGDVQSLKQALDSMGKVDVLIHCGDGHNDLESIENLEDTKVISVRGNYETCNHQEDAVVKLNGKTFYIVHGHQYNVKFGLTNLYYRAKEVGADFALYGHSHICSIYQYDDITFINPGSVSRPRGHKDKSYVIIYNDLSSEIIFFN